MSRLYLNKPQFEAELFRCLNCTAKPCMSACPVNCSPQEFIQHAKKGEFKEAVASICKNNPMGHTCGLICPDQFCMKACLRGKIDFPINIPLVQATLISKYRQDMTDTDKQPDNGKKIAIVGAGPAGMAAAWVLVKLGYGVKLFEKSDKVGGALNLIPDYRLPYEVIEDDWNYIKRIGNAEIEFNKRVDNPVELLERGFDGVIMAIGEQNGIDLGVEGEENVVPYAEYLQRPQEFADAKRVGIIGGGNVAADCAVTARNQGADSVSVFVRRKIFDMKVTRKEMEELIDRQIDLVTTTRVCKVVKHDGKLDAYTCSTRPGERGYEDIPDSVIRREGFDLIIKAIGSRAEKPIEHSNIIYAGDCKTGGSTIVEAVASGLDSARLLHGKISEEKSA